MRKEMLFGFLCLSVAAVVTPAQSGALPFTWHSDQLVEDNAGQYGYSPHVTISGNNVVVVWCQADGAYYRIHSSYSTDGGATWRPDRLIEDNAGYSAADPQVAASGNKVVAVWSQDTDDVFSICSNYSEDGGATWHSDQTIGDGEQHSLAPQVAVSGNNAVAIWTRVNGDVRDLWSNYSTDGGATWHENQLVAEDIEKDHRAFRVALSGDKAVVVWARNDGTSYRVRSSCSDDAGATWRSEQPLEDHVGREAHYPRVVISGQKVAAVWYQSDGTAYRIYSNHSTDGGITWDSARLIEDNVACSGCNPEVAISGNRVVAVWDQWDAGAFRVHSNYSDDVGATWHADQVIQDSVDCAGAQVAMSGRNVTVVCYRHDGNNYRIYANYSLDGGITWHGEESIEDNAGYDGRLAEVGVSGHGAVAVWYQDDATTSRIYSNYILLPGRGNVNCDDAVNIADALFCLRMALWLPIKVDGETYHFPYPEELRLLADMDSDGVVMVDDAIRCLMAALQPDDEL